MSPATITLLFLLFAVVMFVWEKMDNQSSLGFANLF